MFTHRKYNAKREMAVLLVLIQSMGQFTSSVEKADLVNSTNVLLWSDTAHASVVCQTHNLHLTFLKSSEEFL